MEYNSLKMSGSKLIHQGQQNLQLDVGLLRRQSKDGFQWYLRDLFHFTFHDHPGEKKDSF